MNNVQVSRSKNKLKIYLYFTLNSFLLLTWPSYLYVTEF